MSNKEIIALIKGMNHNNDEITFTHPKGRDNKMETFKITVHIAESDPNNKLYAVDRLWMSMNVNKIGPTCLSLYTFDMMGNKTTSKIKYELMEEVTYHPAEVVETEMAKS